MVNLSIGVLAVMMRDSGPVDMESLLSLVESIADSIVEGVPGFSIVIDRDVDGASCYVIDFDETEAGVIAVSVTGDDPTIEPVTILSVTLDKDGSPASSRQRMDFVSERAEMFRTLENLIEIAKRG